MPKIISNSVGRLDGRIFRLSQWGQSIGSALQSNIAKPNNLAAALQGFYCGSILGEHFLLIVLAVLEY